MISKRYLVVATLLVAVTAITSAQTMWLLVGGDTRDPVLGRGAARDVTATTAFFSRAAEAGKLTLKASELKDNNFSLANLNKSIGTIAPGSNDIVVVFVSGDGRKSEKSQWPDLAIDGKFLNVLDLYKQLAAKKPRLLLVLVDLPQKQSKSPEAFGKRPSPSGVKVDNFESLFLQARQGILATSAKADQPSLALLEGGVFTVDFLATLRTALGAATATTWPQILQTSANQVAEDTNQVQTPLFLIEPFSQATATPTLTPRRQNNSSNEAKNTINKFFDTNPW